MDAAVARSCVHSPSRGARSRQYLQSATAICSGLSICEMAPSRAVVDAHQGLISALAFRPDGKVLATASEADGEIRLWDTLTGAALASIDTSPAKESAESLAFSPDGSLLASGHWPASDHVSRVVLWELATLQPLHVMEDQAPGRIAEGVIAAGGRIVGVGYINNGKTLISAHEYENRVSFWDVASGKPLGYMLPTRSGIHGLAVSP